MVVLVVLVVVLVVLVVVLVVLVVVLVVLVVVLVVLIVNGFSVILDRKTVRQIDRKLQRAHFYYSLVTWTIKPPSGFW